MEPNETPENQSLIQKKIAFAQSDHIEAVIALLKDATHKGKLVGDSEYETLVNAIRMDSQGDMIIAFINSLDQIKRGEIVNKQ